MKPNELFDLSGKVAIVTGGNRGLGLGMALGLAKAGANIVVGGRDEARTSQAVATIKALGVDATGVAVDVAQESDIVRMTAHAVGAFGKVDILVNNAGIALRRPPQDLTAGEWDQVLDVNLRSAFLASREVYPYLKEQGGGKIINIGSMFSLFGSDFAPPYSVSKGGLVQLTKSLAVAWAMDNIQVNALLPGWFVTELTEGIPSNDPARYELINQRIPAGRWAQPEELQGAAIFLASSASNYVTGAVLTVDGGYSVK